MDEFRKTQLSVPSFYFLLFILNKIKISIFRLLPELSMQYKNTSKIKVLQMPWKLNMIFIEYLRIYCAKITAGGADTWPRGWRARPTPLGTPPVSWAHGGPPPLIPTPIFFLYLTQTRKTNSSTIFDLLSQSTSRKTAWGDCFLLCDSSIGPISFCSSVLLQICAA